MKNSPNTEEGKGKQKLPDWYVQKKEFGGEFGSVNILYGSSLISFNTRNQNWIIYNKFLEDKSYQVLPYCAIGAVPSVNKIYITGGLDNLAPRGDVVVVTWDPDSWGSFDATVTNNPEQELITPRYLHTVVVKGTQVYVLGGQTSPDTYTAKCETPDGALPDLNIARSTFSGVSHGDRVFVIGGFSGPGQVAQSIEVLNESDSAWEQIALPDPFVAGISAVICDSSILIFGGSDGQNASNRILRLNTASNEITGEAEATKNAYAGAIATFDPTNRNVFIFGGGAQSGEICSESDLTSEFMEKMIQPPEPFTPYFLVSRN